MKSNDTSTRKRSNGKLPFIAMIVLAVIFLVVVVRIIFLLIPEKVHLNEFISLELSGYNTVGEARIVFDYNSFIEQYGEIIKFKNESAREQFIQDYPDSADITPAAGWLMLVKVGLSQYTGLSNGDLITLKSNSADSAVKLYFNRVAEYAGTEYVVEGLEEPSEIDILGDLAVAFAGYSPDIAVETAELPSRWDVLENLNINVSKSEHLSEGETIEVSLTTIDGTDINEYLATCGYKPTAVSRTFTAAGDGHYITSSAEIPDDIMQELQKRSEELYTAYLHTKDGSEYKWTHDVNSMNYAGSLLLTGKDAADTDTVNTLYLVYEVSTYITAKPSPNSRTTYKNNVIWYFVSKYDNITLDQDGTCNIVPDELSLDQTGEVGFYADDAQEISSIYYGYATIEDISAQLIEPYAASYDCENKLNKVNNSNEVTE